MLLIGIMMLFRGSVAIAQASLQLWILLLAGLIFGVRGVLVTLFINLTAIAVAGYAVTTGLTPPISEVLWNPALPNVWIRSGLILALFGSSSALTVAVIVNQLEKETNLLRQSLAREQEQRHALEVAEKDYLQAQNDLADAQRIEALGKVASGVAHDFNNSLTIIMGSAEIAQLDPSNTAQVDKSLKSIVRASVNAAELTRRLLSFGHKDQAKEVNIEVKSFIAALTESLSRLLPDDIALRITDAESANILVDKPGLERALFNLVANFKDAIVGAGQIFIGSKSLILTSNRGEVTAGEYVVISVSDDGAGIQQDIKSSDCESYFNTKKIGNGKGMALALLQSLIQDSRGHVQLESGCDQGTTVSLFFPIAEPKEKAAATPSVDDLIQVDTKELSILLVEDNAEVLATTADMLSQTGFEIFQCASGDAALAAIDDEARKFDLLCVDGVIPGASSAEVINAFKHRRPSSPIVVCSGYVEEELIVRGIKTGELSYVKKPYRSQELISAIYSALNIS
ncbi:MAG: signal transduction histidine kinase/CheY-like chemotaxis protein [Pseudohongiellaceae bacterium]|jgi:signal transduction histidine kinase/CheY-like chemotaxis protein